MDHPRSFPRPEPVAPRATFPFNLFVGLIIGTLLATAVLSIVNIRRDTALRQAEATLLAPPHGDIPHFVRPSTR
jgi:hypothetical protein